MCFSLLLLLVLDDDEESLTIIDDDKDDGDDLANNCCRRSIDLLPLLTHRILRYSILLLNVFVCVCILVNWDWTSIEWIDWFCMIDFCTSMCTFNIKYRFACCTCTTFLLKFFYFQICCLILKMGHMYLRLKSILTINNRMPSMLLLYLNIGWLLRSMKYCNSKSSRT